MSKTNKQITKVMKVEWWWYRSYRSFFLNESNEDLEDETAQETHTDFYSRLQTVIQPQEQWSEKRLIITSSLEIVLYTSRVDSHENHSLHMIIDQLVFHEREDEVKQRDLSISKRFILFRGNRLETGQERKGNRCHNESSNNVNMKRRWCRNISVCRSRRLGS
jgi:hypothetical protein